MTPATIYMVRHGTTYANKEDRFAGHGPFALHPDGEVQMKEVADRLKEKSIQTIFVGTMNRTMRSGTIIAKTLKCPVYRNQGLDDMRIPHWDGKTKKEITRAYGTQYPTWKKTPHLLKVAGCETLLDVQNRALDCLEQIHKLYQDSCVLVVSHLIVLRALVLHYQGKGLEQFRSVAINNGDILSLTLCPTGVRVRMTDP